MSSLRLTWFRVTGDSESEVTLIPGRAMVVGTDLIFTDPTVMDTGTYACQVGAKVRTSHTITFNAPSQGE